LSYILNSTVHVPSAVLSILVLYKEKCLLTTSKSAAVKISSRSEDKPRGINSPFALYLYLVHQTDFYRESREKMSSLLADRAVLPAEMAARVSQLEADFAVQFGQRPQLLVRVPGRVNLIGKHDRYENFNEEDTPLLLHRR